MKHKKTKIPKYFEGGMVMHPQYEAPDMRKMNLAKGAAATGVGTIAQAFGVPAPLATLLGSGAGYLTSEIMGERKKLDAAEDRFQAGVRDANYQNRAYGYDNPNQYAHQAGGLYAEQGMVVPGMDNRQLVEMEKGEVAVDPNNEYMDTGDTPHRNGGDKMMAQPGTTIYPTQNDTKMRNRIEKLSKKKAKLEKEMKEAENDPIRMKSLKRAANNIDNELNTYKIPLMNNVPMGMEGMPQFAYGGIVPPFGTRKPKQQDGPVADRKTWYEKDRAAGATVGEDGLTDAERGMMKSKVALEDAFGNPAGKRLTNTMADKDKYDFGDGDVGTHFMQSQGNYAVPLIQADESGKLQLDRNRRWEDKSKENMYFDDSDDAILFSEKYKKVSPAFRDNVVKYKSGGIVPKYQPGGIVPDPEQDPMVGAYSVANLPGLIKPGNEYNSTWAGEAMRYPNSVGWENLGMNPRRRYNEDKFKTTITDLPFKLEWDQRSDWGSNTNYGGESAGDNLLSKQNLSDIADIEEAAKLRNATTTSEPSTNPMVLANQIAVGGYTPTPTPDEEVPMTEAERQHFKQFLPDVENYIDDLSGQRNLSGLNFRPRDTSGDTAPTGDVTRLGALKQQVSDSNILQQAGDYLGQHAPLMYNLASALSPVEREQAQYFQPRLKDPTVDYAAQLAAANAARRGSMKAATNMATNAQQLAALQGQAYANQFMQESDIFGKAGYNERTIRNSNVGILNQAQMANIAENKRIADINSRNLGTRQHFGAAAALNFKQDYDDALRRQQIEQQMANQYAMDKMRLGSLQNMNEFVYTKDGKVIHRSLVSDYDDDGYAILNKG